MRQVRPHVHPPETDDPHDARQHGAGGPRQLLRGDERERRRDRRVPGNPPEITLDAFAKRDVVQDAVRAVAAAEWLHELGGEPRERSPDGERRGQTRSTEQ